MNTSQPADAVHESDYLEINCTIDYRGSWMPVINCTPDVQAQLVEQTPSRVSYTGVVAAADIGNWTVISCETSFVRLEWSIPASQQVKRILDTPRYNHTWHSSPIRVFNTTGNRLFAVKVGRATKESAVIFLLIMFT